MKDRGGGTSSPSPSAPPPVAISPRSTAWGDPGEEPDTAAPLISPRTDPAPGGGGGGAPQARVEWGGRREAYGYPYGGADGVGLPAEVRYLERERQGRGNKFPLPVGPSPRGDIHTVQYPGISRRRTWHGCPPGIATHGPRPLVGAGEERRRRGWGLPAEVHGYPLPKARAGWGLPAGVHGYPCEGAGGVGGPARSVWVSPRRRGRGGAAGGGKVSGA